MDKDKLIKGGIWLSGFSMSIMISAFSIFIGFNNVNKQDDYTILILGLLLLPLVFYCAYRGFKLVLEAIFN
ncbi:MAG: DUF6095 family protein [Flavobacteriales bacterium]|jgi:hypothetical protein|nr:hypothetical protein [Flavobacteriales bacterium]MBT4345825.1 hypothetical protein [Flavobacteriales bacterium]MDA7578341.1 DUF6095 family protein [Flavobacteriales bacterium]MDC0908715.1 DUF6095 family protein [Flavobacteriales bacterium]MDC1069451.1 DUF6095 family protein [Flavobacteriales bacterium]|tara:strand:- start:272 stop:484 length:213 start_codon:yes stop_codon:yes gene_type:complete